MSKRQQKDWLGYVERLILEHDDIPLLGGAPEFPIHELSLKIAQKFKLEDFAIEYSDFKWSMPSDLWEGLGENIKKVAFHLPPLEGLGILGVSSVDLSRLMAWVLNHKQSTMALFDYPLQEGFMHYLGAELMKMIEELNYLKGMQLRIASKETIETEPSLISHLRIKLGQETVCARLALSSTLRKGYAKQWSMRPEMLSEDKLSHIEVAGHITMGQVQLPLSEWNNVETGDFICLDKCFYDPFEKKGRLFFTVGDKPLFRVLVKSGSVKLLENPFYEEDSTMDEEELNDAEGFNDDDEEMTFDEELEEFPESEKEELEEEGEENIAVKEADESTSISSEDIPITITVEVKRLKMNAKTLLNLRPGNLLELDIEPEAPVNLTSSGKRVGRGELIRIGDVLGVRVLEIG